MKNTPSSNLLHRLGEPKRQHDFSGAIGNLDPSAQIDAAIANIIADDCPRLPYCPLPRRGEIGKVAAQHILSEPGPIAEMKVVARQ